MTAITRIPRPQRWQQPFGPDMTEADVERVLGFEPFASMDAARFAEPMTLQGIIQHDTRIVHYAPGDIVVRAGDYGNSAFLIMTGRLRVVLPPGMPAEELGRAPETRKSAWQAVGMLWKNARTPEQRDVRRYAQQTLTRDTANSHGETRAFLQDVPSILSQYQTAEISAGEIVGEIAALGRTQRTATMIAEDYTEVLEIRWQGLREIRRRDEAFRKHVENVYRSRSLVSHLRETPLFRHLSDDQLNHIADQTLFETFGDFDWHTSYKRFTDDPPEVRLKREPLIVDEGDYADGLLMIRSGFGRVSQHMNLGEKTLRYMGRGGVFGLAEIVEGWIGKQAVPLRTSLRAVGYTDVLRVPTTVIEEHVLPSLSEEEIAEIRDELKPRDDVAERVTTVGRSGRQHSLDPALLEMLVDNRLINGTQAMVINLDRCVRCDACVDACAVGHNNNPRFNRHGRRYGPTMVANACMHCADPVCMIGCPTGAIHRSDRGGQVLINDDTCIGCATCANSCPYDNIRMVDIRDNNGAFIRDEAAAKPIRKATKCDLCAGLPGGPACERACPHDALKRIDLRDLGALADWIDR